MHSIIEHPLLIAALVFISVTGCTALLGPALTRRYRAKLQKRLNKSCQPVTGQPRTHNLKAEQAKKPTGGSKLLECNEQTERLVSKLMRAAGYDSQIATTLFSAVRLLCTLGPLLLIPLIRKVTGLSIEESACICAALGFLGFMAPMFWLRGRIAQRHQRLRNSLSDFLDLFVTCVESGTNLQALFPLVSNELKSVHPELSNEFLLCAEEVELGATLNDTIAALAERTALDDLNAFSTLIRQSNNYGATLGEALRELSIRLRLQREVRAEERAQKAAVQILLPTLFFIFPAIFMVLVAPAGIKIHQSFSQMSANNAK